MTTTRVAALPRSRLGLAWYSIRTVVFYRVCTCAARCLFASFTRWKVVGQENVPRKGGFLVVSNHLTYLDPPLLSSALKRRRIVFMAKEELWSTGLHWVATGFGAFPIRRGEMDRDALRRALNVLEQGHVLGMFPEGTRAIDHRLQKAEPGTAYIALRSGVPIVPVAITGTQDVFPGGKLQWPKRVRVVATIGKPFHLPPLDRAQQRECMGELGELIMQRIRELLPEDYR